LNIYGNNSNKREIDNLVISLNLLNTVFNKLQNKLNTKVGTNGYNLSNGQIQIVLILRAFLQNKKILIFDEPTNALDQKTKEIILDTIKKISKNKTTIIVTHDPDVTLISDKIYSI